MSAWGWIVLTAASAEGVFFAVKAARAENARDRERRRADLAEQKAAVNDGAAERLARIEARARVEQKLGPNRQQRRKAAR